MKERLIYIHPGLSTFARKDIAILEKEFDLIIFQFKVNDGKSVVYSFIRQFFFLFRHSFSSTKIIIQFGGFQSFVPVFLKRIFRYKVVIVLGGTDCVSFPSIQYGCYYNKRLKRLTKYSLKNADLLLPVDDSLIEYDYTYTSDDYPKQGYRYHIPKIQTPYKVIYNGYSGEKWQSLPKESNTFVTVAADLSTRFGPKLKGIDLIIDVAPNFPQCTFYIVGGDKLSIIPPNNVILENNKYGEDLYNFVASKEFYIQWSMSEGFPNGLCEAMLTSCIPIVSSVGAMPKIVDETGYILQKKNIKTAIEQITEALSDPLRNTKGIYARKRIEENFTIRNRSEQLIATLRNL